MEEFLDTLPKKAAAKAIAVFRLVAEQPTLSGRFLKKLSGTELFEIRALYAKRAYRFPCFFAGDAVVVLTHGFGKKSQKTPQKELQRAESYRYDYLRRYRS